MTIINQIVESVRLVVRWVTVIALGWMVCLAGLQLILRWVFDTGLLWGDIQLQNLVLVVAMLGGVLAASENRHIRIDILENYHLGLFSRISGRVVLFFSSVGSIYLGWLGFQYVSFKKSENIELHSILFGKTISAWYIDLFIPVCFILMAFFFFAGVITRKAVSARIARRF